MKRITLLAVVGIFLCAQVNAGEAEVPVARTIVIDPAAATYPIVVSEKGRPDGWIRYTTKPGAVLGGKDVMKSIFKVSDAKYVILENMVLEGGGGNRDNPVLIENSTGVRVRNCEIYGFGHTGEKGQVRAFDGSAGITIDSGSEEVTVELSYIHDARGTSSSWLCSQPSATAGIFVNRAAHAIVLRWNDIIGSDRHRWNDAIAGCDNSGEGGGSNRDFDIYGNFCFNPTNDIPREWTTNYPVRDLPFILDTGVIKGVQVTGPAATPAAVTFTAEASLDQPFRIRQNFDADWFTVSPAAGLLKKGANRFTVTFIPGKMQDRRFWRSAFLVQTPEGLSRGVSIFAERMDFARTELP